MHIATPNRQSEAGTPARVSRRRPKISVIIPALNEASSIARTLQSIPADERIEVIVADGGSRDDTIRVAEALGASVVRTAPGRAQQMNVGAAAAQGEVLLFLHADTRLPAEFVSSAFEVLRRPGVVVGAFRLRLDAPQWRFRIVEALANFRSRWFKLPYGDQALFLRRFHFRMAAGFSRLPIMEDFEFVRRLGRWGRIGLAPDAAVTSARRWKRLGVLRTTLLNQAIILAYLFGVSPNRLARWYRGEAIALENRQRRSVREEAAAPLPRQFPSAQEH
ncbi:MAG: TIGR04283 family arsenosugar biosynthesis glycosyltransferase [Verrucomicrobiales bacterium]|nr:TIGR04283 family arsenosugar biosynthesis glycosyltransferase [Verrucomicrobiales bacterium]